MNRITAISASIVVVALGNVSILAQKPAAQSVASIAAPAAPAAQPTASGITVQEILRRVSQSENTVVTNVRTFKPIVEVYIQNVAPDEQQSVVPAQDTYFLGRFDWKNGPRLVTVNRSKAVPRVPSNTTTGKILEYLPDGFAAMAAPDWDPLDNGRYVFSLVRREFVGEARCFVIDVKPARDIKEGFSGRIWSEDRGYNIVRFNGINRRIEREFFRKTLSFHVDSWRTNVLPGLWLPSYVYVEETALGDTTSDAHVSHIRSQVRLWGYDPRRAQAPQQFTDILLDGPQVRDNAAQQGQLSPVLSQRRWEQEAETNVVERLEKASLLATPGEVERVLDAVVNNLEVTNNIVLDRPVTSRILLTAPFESFTIGHTLVLSRGLIDVLPDEASLAMMLAHELAHVVLGHPVIDTQFAFGDRLMVADEELLRLLKATRTAKEEAAADAKVIEMLQQSPYKDKLADAGLFLKLLATRGRQLPNLVQPHIGDHIAQGGQIMRLTQLMQASPELKQDNLEQVAALSLGARLVLDPWSSQLELLRTAAQLPGAAREKVPLAISPLMPYVKYVEMPPAQEAAK